MKIRSPIPLQQKVENPDQKLREAAQMYERHFLKDMVKAMRNTVQMSKDPSMANRVFTDKMFDQYTDDWAKNGGIGLADVIYTQLKERYFPNQQQLQHPQGPVPLEKTKMKSIQSPQKNGMQKIQEQSPQGTGMGYLFEINGPVREVKNPWDGKVLKNFQATNERSLIKVEHDNGLVSTLSYKGQLAQLSPGDLLKAGQEIGRVSADNHYLNWNIDQMKGKA